jgi:hypothetical protein
MKLAEEHTIKLITPGDIVDFAIVGIPMMGKVLSIFQMDTTLAKVRCIVDKVEQFFYVEIEKLKPARFPEYYKVA